MSKRCLTRCKKPHVKILIREKVIAIRAAAAALARDPYNNLCRDRDTDDPTRPDHFDKFCAFVETSSKVNHSS